MVKSTATLASYGTTGFKFAVDSGLVTIWSGIIILSSILHIGIGMSLVISKVHSVMDD